eukprot:gene7415-544_t
MELGNLEAAREAAAIRKQEENLEEQGADVKLNMKLPDGSVKVAAVARGTLAVGTHTYAAGATVAYVKMTLEVYSLTASSVVLKYNGRPLIDPLSLSDCGIQPGGGVDIEVS